MDRLLQIAENRVTRQLWSTLGLPVHLPQPLRRSTDGWASRPLFERDVVVAAPRGQLGPVLAKAVLECGPKAVHLVLSPGDTLPVGWQRPGVQVGTVTTSLVVSRVADAQAADAPRPDVLILDATGLVDCDSLDELHLWGHQWLPLLRANGRVVVIGRSPGQGASAAAHAASRALDGFVRSVAKELGRSGATANLLNIDSGADEASIPALRFLFSDLSSFITGQPWRVTSTCRAPASPISTLHILTGKLALVTGAARGIGAATARALAREGARVVCLDRPQEMEALTTLAQSIGGEVLALNITDAGAPKQLFEHFSRVHPAVDIVVHNAGITRDKTLARMSEEAWRQVLDVNLRAVLRMTEALMPQLAPEARIVLTASVAGIAGNAGQTNYAASKAALIGLASAWAQELGGRGIGVCAVAPGFIETRMTQAVPLLTREAGRRLNSLNQGGLPEDVAELVCLLASPGAFGLSGGVFRCCGGMLLGA